MNDVVSTALDVLGLLTVASGTFFACEPFMGGAALVPAGVVVMGVSAAWHWVAGRRAAAEKGGQP